MHAAWATISGAICQLLATLFLAEPFDEAVAFSPLPAGWTREGEAKCYLIATSPNIAADQCLTVLLRTEPDWTLVVLAHSRLVTTCLCVSGFDGCVVRLPTPTHRTDHVVAMFCLFATSFFTAALDGYEAVFQF
jgi:hypothetical protein